MYALYLPLLPFVIEQKNTIKKKERKVFKART